MRRTVGLLALVAVLAFAGLAGVGGSSAVDAKGVANASHLTPGPGNDSTLVDRETLFETEVSGGPDDHTATLYFVAEDGTWYHAFPNGSIGAPAPDGDEIPLLSGETHEVPPDERPTYLWKVVSDDECSTTFYDAEKTSDVAPRPIPNCPPQTQPTPTPTESPTTTGDGPGAGTTTAVTRGTGGTTRESTTPGQPGFDTALAVVSLVGTAWVALGRR